MNLLLKSPHSHNLRLETPIDISGRESSRTCQAGTAAWAVSLPQLSIFRRYRMSKATTMPTHCTMLHGKPMYSPMCTHDLTQSQRVDYTDVLTGLKNVPFETRHMQHVQETLGLWSKHGDRHRELLHGRTTSGLPQRDIQVHLEITHDAEGWPIVPPPPADGPEDTVKARTMVIKFISQHYGLSPIVSKAILLTYTGRTCVKQTKKCSSALGKAERSKSALERVYLTQVPTAGLYLHLSNDEHAQGPGV